MKPLHSRVILALLIAALWPGSLRAAEVEREERWYVVRFQGSHAGWLHEESIESGDTITSINRMHLAIKRGPFTVTMDMSDTFVETVDGKPISATMTQKMAQEEIEKTVTFKPEGLEVVTRQGGREDRETLPVIVKPWLTPAAASRYVEERIGAGEKAIRFSALDLSTSFEPHGVTIELLGETVVEALGKQVPALHCRVSLSHLPGAKMEEFATLEGETIKSTMDFGAMQMEVLAADKELAMSGIDPPELVASTLVEPSFTLLRPREKETGVYRLSVAEGHMPDLEESPVQTVRRIDERTIEVRIDLAATGAGGGEAPVIRNNTMIAGDDEEVVKLTREAAERAGESKAERAEAMRRFVGKHIRVADLSVGMASASEVARTRNGDCTEHAVLLAAMLQADGIPARTASGLIYVDEFIGKRHIFGYHMWTQAWLDGRWVDLDATLDNPFDAAHILMGTSHLGNEDSTNEMVTTAPLMGRLRIDLGE